MNLFKYFGAVKEPSVRKCEYKKVKLNGKQMIATKYEGDTHWVVPHDHQEELKILHELQEAQNV